ncbi:MAG TPA: hypothetical protein VE912_11590 [Bacteroidales bacterium]|nr:hypothetical protein [Bacteroidales bacterium]
MTQGDIASENCQLPTHLLLFVVISALAVPLTGRIFASIVLGWECFEVYWGIVSQKVFVFSALNLIPAFWWFLAGKLSRRFPYLFWMSYGTGMLFLLYAHGTIDLQSSSTAVLGFLFYPLYGLGISIISWFVGWVIHHFGLRW